MKYHKFLAELEEDILQHKHIQELPYGFEPDFSEILLCAFNATDKDNKDYLNKIVSYIIGLRKNTLSMAVDTTYFFKRIKTTIYNLNVILENKDKEIAALKAELDTFKKT